MSPVTSVVFQTAKCNPVCTEKGKAIAYFTMEMQQKPGELWQEAPSLVPRWLWAAPEQGEAPQHHPAHLCEPIVPWWCQQSMLIPHARQEGDMDANPLFAPPLPLLLRLGWRMWTPVWLSSASWAWSSFCFQTLLLLPPVCFFSFCFSLHFFFGNIVLSYNWVCA